jgi:hypothetical protein
MFSIKKDVIINVNKKYNEYFSLKSLNSDNDSSVLRIIICNGYILTLILFVFVSIVLVALSIGSKVCT